MTLANLNGLRDHYNHFGSLHREDMEKLFSIAEASLEVTPATVVAKPKKMKEEA